MPDASKSLSQPLPFMLAIYHIVVRLQLRLNFSALRMANPQRFPQPTAKTIVFLNHASWWDPVPSMLLHHRMMPYATLHAPVDSKALRRNRSLAWLGMFPVDTGTLRGAKQFLKSARAVLDSPHGVLWITPEGDFVDPRKDEIELRRGLSMLIASLGEVTVIPLALEYTFWEKSKPEILANWGEPLLIKDGHSHSAGEWHQILTKSLSETKAELSEMSIKRQGNRFHMVFHSCLGSRTLRQLVRDVRQLFEPRRPLAQPVRAKDPNLEWPEPVAMESES